LRQGGRFREPVDVLDRRAELTTNPREARAFLREAAEFLVDQIGDTATGVSRLENIVADNPRDVSALRMLERIYDRTGQIDEHLKTLERLADAVPDQEERIRLCRRVAAAWAHRTRRDNPGAPAPNRDPA